MRGGQDERPTEVVPGDGDTADTQVTERPGREPSQSIDIELDADPAVSGTVSREGSHGPLPDSGRRFGRYDLLGRLAVGGMAEVYLAREVVDEHVERAVVVKVLKSDLADSSEFVLMFRDEARLGTQLRHPYIAHVYEYGQHQHRHYIAMEWIKGISLSTHLKRLFVSGKRIPLTIAVAIVAKVSEALDYAHHAASDDGAPLGVVHRDVSPQNIVVSYDGVIKLLDFGVAKASARLTTTRSGVVRGKFAYMSPEQCLGKAGVDHRSDIFSLGVVLYELLTGVSPFIRSTEVGTLRAVMEDPIGRPEHRNAAVDTELSDIVMRALERDAGARYGSARELQTALEAWSTRRGEPLSSTRIADHVREVWADDIQRGVQLSVDTDLLASLPRSRRHLTPTPVFGDPTRPVRIQRHEAPRPKRQNRRFAFGVSELVAAILLGSVITWLAWPEPPSAADKAIGKPEATVGRVTVESTPPGATVYENGHPIGVTPLALVTMSPGRHTIELRLEGHQPTVIDLDVGPEATVVQRQLVPEGGAE